MPLPSPQALCMCAGKKVVMGARYLISVWVNVSVQGENMPLTKRCGGKGARHCFLFLHIHVEEIVAQRDGILRAVAGTTKNLMQLSGMVLLSCPWDAS